MASVKDIENQISELETVLQNLNNATATAGGEFVYAGKTYSAKQLESFASTVEKDINSLKKSIKPVFDARKKLQAASATGDPFTPMSPQQKKIVEAEKKKVASVESVSYVVPKLTGGVPSVSGGTTPAGTVVPETEMTAEQLSEAAGRGRMGVTGGFGATAPRKPATTKTPAKPKVAGGGQVPRAAGEFPGDTKVSGGVTYTWNGTKWVTGKGLNTEQVIAKFKQMFPTQAWLTEIDPAKYPEVRGLLQRAVVGEMWKTPQGLERFKTEWEATDFFTELKTDNQVKTITSLVGDLGFDSVPFNQFLTTSMNMGWKGDTLKAEVYKEVFRKDDAGAYVNKTAFERVKKSNEYLSVAKIGKDYFSEVSDTDVEGVLTGGMLTQDVQRKQRELAKTKYGHLADLIEQGFTLAELSTPFKQQAASILEKSPDAINMSEANFEAAYNFGEPGQKRMMTSGEWEIMLRSDAKYGWDKTNNAKAEARQLATSIAQAFGKVI